MKLNKSKNANVNYLAKVVELKEFAPHINPEVTRLKVAHVDGFNILVGIDEQPGKFVYFPTSCCINPQFLSFANLYKHAELNANPEKSGMFEDNGRVKAIKLKGQVSEGFLLPLQMLLDFVVSSTNVPFTEDDCPVGTEFDEVEHKGKSFWINKKYVVRQQQGGNSAKDKKYDRRQKKLKKFNRVIDEQFHFHYDTVILRKEPEVIKPWDLIHLSHKWHGTSAIFAYVLCKHPLNLGEKIAKVLTKNEFHDYDYLYSSRSVIKNANINRGVTDGFYGEGGGDIWKIAFEYIKPYLIKGMTIYAELVGYLPNGKFIQKNYDYGCELPKANEEYTQGKHYKVMVYRITLTNPDGIVHEFSAREVRQWCEAKGLTPVIECYYGYAKDLYPELNNVKVDPMPGVDEGPSWSEAFMDKLANDERFYMEKNSPDCINKVPHEGLVIKKEDMRSRAWKLKCFKFLNKEQEELDKGEENIEDLA